MGCVTVLQAEGPGGSPLPVWMVFDKVTGLFEGVPTVQDVGEHYVTVRALGQQSHDWAKDVFSIDVTENSRTGISKGAVPLAVQQQKVTGHIQVKVSYESLNQELINYIAAEWMTL
jgi:hypothetical protein